MDVLLLCQKNTSTGNTSGEFEGFSYHVASRSKLLKDGDIGGCPGKGKIDINIEALAGISGQWPVELETYFLPHLDTSPVRLAYGASLL